MIFPTSLLIISFIGKAISQQIELPQHCEFDQFHGDYSISCMNPPSIFDFRQLHSLYPNHDQKVTANEFKLMEDQHTRHIPANSFNCGLYFRNILITNTVIETIDKKAFDSQINLQKISMNYGKLRDPNVFRAFSSLPSLQELDLTYNSLKSIPGNAFIRSDGTPMVSLRHLDLKHNSIRSVADGALSYLPNLEYLNLAENNLQYIGIKMFQFPASYKKSIKIDISHNQITHIDDGAFHHVTRENFKLDIRYNKLTKFQGSVFQVNNMRHCDALGNRFRCDCNDLYWLRSDVPNLVAAECYLPGHPKYEVIAFAFQCPAKPKALPPMVQRNMPSQLPMEHDFAPIVPNCSWPAPHEMIPEYK